MHNKINTEQSLLTIQQAADYLGVHTGTIRRWAYAKRIKGSKIGVRGDWRFQHGELLKLANSEENLEPKQSTVPSSDWSTFGDTSHFVQFYEDDIFLTNEIRKFIASGDSAIVVITPDHKERIENGLTLYGLDIEEAQKQGHYIYMDAAETLLTFMVDGMPDADLCFQTIGGLLTRASRNKKQIRIFGEMVALLWAEGNHDAAIALEKLWNKLQEIHHFTLFCAYPIKGFNEQNHAIPFQKIAQTHSHVVPTEKYSSLLKEDTRLREIALLQQKAQSLEAEILRHKQTQLKLLETVNALRISEAFNRNIVESSADCIKVLDLQGTLLSFNGPGCKMMEIDDVSQFIGREWLSLWEGKYYELAKTAFEDAKQGNMGRFQGCCPTAKGTQKWWDVVVTPVYDGDEVQKVVAVSRDISTLKELEQRKEDFLSATSHELKTPLTSQKAFIQLLGREIQKTHDPKYTRYVTKINEQTDKLTKLVTDLLDVTKVHGGKLVLDSTLFNLNDCIHETVEEIQTVTKSHTIIVTGSVFSNVYGDRNKIAQILTNLLTNAIKYSPKADKVIVSIKNKKMFVEVKVQDFGIGIDNKNLEHLFERFYRVNDSDEKTYPGLGMGLYIAAEIIKQHGGRINVESMKGKGSTFSFTIPLQ